MNTSHRASHADIPTDAVARLLALAGERGYLIHADLIDALPPERGTQDALDAVYAALADIGITVLDEPPHAAPFTEPAPVDVDRDALDESSAVLDAIAHGATASTDPLTLYLRRMHAVPLLTHDEEITLAREIEAGRREILQALAGFPAAVDALLSHHIGAGASGNANDTPAGATHAMLRKSAVAVRRALHTYGSRSTGYRNTCARLAARLESVAWPASAIEDACRIALTLPSPETRDSTSRDQAPASLDETTRLALLATLRAGRRRVHSQ